MGKFQLDPELRDKAIPSIVNYPSIETLQGSLNTYKQLLSCLEKRIVLIGQNGSSLTEYEQNENQIKKIKTHAEINHLNKIIEQKEINFISVVHQFSKDMNSFEKGFNSLLKTLNNREKDDKEITQILKEIDWEKVDKNDEYKIRVFNNLKNLVDKW